jgi:hypothetical protein
MVQADKEWIVKGEQFLFICLLVRSLSLSLLLLVSVTNSRNKNSERQTTLRSSLVLLSGFHFFVLTWILKDEQEAISAPGKAE